jgi:hypothetical protein
LSWRFEYENEDLFEAVGVMTGDQFVDIFLMCIVIVSGLAALLAVFGTHMSSNAPSRDDYRTMWIVLFWSAVIGGGALWLM